MENEKMKNIRLTQNIISKIGCSWKYEFLDVKAVIKFTPEQMFFSKIVIWSVLEEQIDENPTSHGLILIKFDMLTAECVP